MQPGVEAGSLAMQPPIAEHSPVARSFVGWQGRLNEASTAHEVAAVAREFVAQLGTDELRELPEGCQPGAIANARNVVCYALKLAHRHVGDARSAPVLHRISTFFTKAALRIVQIEQHRTEVQRESVGTSAWFAIT